MTSSLRLLFGAVGFLLLIACANVANCSWLVLRAARKKIAMRMAVGAGRHRVVRQLLTESIVLSLVGGVLGILLAIGITKAIVALMPVAVAERVSRHRERLRAALSVAISMLTGILFGLVPALQCSRPDLVESLKDSGKGAGAGMRGGRTRNILAVAEVALSDHTARRRQSRDSRVCELAACLEVLAFQSDRVLMVGLNLAEAYASYEQRVAFTQLVLPALAKTFPACNPRPLEMAACPLAARRRPPSKAGRRE